MQATPPLAASAQALTDANVRSWLPARARFSIKNRLFSKNILYSRDVWARGTATWSSTCIFAGLISALAFFAYIYFVKTNVSQGSSNQTKPLWQLSSMLADDATINRLDTELDSDEYQDEQQSSRSSGFLANSKERLALRRMLGRNENKRSSIVRIVSSDPTSNLCENPMQVDLEPTTKRSFWPAPVSNTPPSDSSNPNSPTAASPSPSSATPRQASGSPTPAATRRRKESGRFLAGEVGRRQHSASPSRSPLSSTSGLPTRPARVRPVDTRSPLSRTARNKRNSTSSLSSADGLNSPKLPPPTTKPAVEEAIWADEAGTPVDERDEAQGTPSMASEASFASVAHGHTSASPEHEDAPSPSACSSPTSSTFSISRAPSILKRRPQTFRTASLRDIDISYSLMQRKASLPAFPLLADPAAMQQQQQQEMWQQANGMFLPHPFAGSPAPPPYQPSTNPELAPQCPTDPSPDSATSGQNKQRSIKLIEPDWRPHIDSHIRARERLDTATRFAAFKMATDGAGAMESKFDSDDVDVNDFWFERFTQSTAAAGRDWDWRKRRARLQRAAALGMALGQSGLASPPAPSPLPGNIGKTDVQLQHQHTGSSEPASAAQAASPMRKTLPSAPLITFTEQKLATAPVLKIDTESGRRDAPLSPALRGNGTPLSPTPSGTGTPLGGIFGAVLPSADSVSAHMAARMAQQRRRASEDATILPPTSSISPNSTLKNGAINRINRRRISASAAAAGGVPSSPGPSSQSSSPTAEGLPNSPLGEYASSPLASGGEVGRASFDAGSSSSSPPPPLGTGMSGSFSVPGRLSSLGSVGKKVSLTNLRAGLRRGSGSGDFLQESTGIELVPNSPDLVADGDREHLSASTPSPEGPRSSADAYSSPPVPVPDDGSLSRTDLRLRQQEGSLRSKKQPSYRGGFGVAKQSSAPAAQTTYNQEEILEELRADSERDSNSTSKGSIDSSDSLRRRLRSQTDTAPTSRKDVLASLPPSSSPPVSKGRARNGSRSSIMRSASGASSELSRSGRRRSSSILNSDSGSITSSVLSQTGTTGTRTGSIRKQGSPKQSRASVVPDPSMQPEPAPRGMAQRARSASLSSQNSSLASDSRRGSTSNSFRGEAGTGIGLMMTSSTPGTPASGDERRDPFSMTSLNAH